MIAPILVPMFASREEVDSIVERIVGDLDADNEQATPQALAQLRALIEAASWRTMMPLHPIVAEEITRLREMDYGVEVLRNDASTALIRLIGGEEAIICLIDVAQLDRADETTH